VQDAAYLVTVPAIVPDTHHLMRDPVIAYLPDDFQRPYPFQPTVIVDVGPVLEKITAMLDCHKSQFYEWLAYNHGYLDRLPEEDAARRTFLKKETQKRLKPRADKYRELLTHRYGKKRGAAIEYAEAFEGCEYGAPLDAVAQERLFGFLK
jgi:hypothetical protein